MLQLSTKDSNFENIYLSKLCRRATTVALKMEKTLKVLPYGVRGLQMAFPNSFRFIFLDTL